MTIKNNGVEEEGKCKFIHFNLEKRKDLSRCIKEGMKLHAVADQIKMSESSISRELKRNRVYHKNNRIGTKCIKVKECNIKNLCKDKKCNILCKHCCYDLDCQERCAEFESAVCKRIQRFPYVCDGCSKARACRLDFYWYNPEEADRKANLALVESRRGINLTEEQFAELDRKLVEGTKKNQSVEHMASYCNFPVSSRTVRRYIEGNLTTVKKLDTPRGAVYKPRKQNVSIEHRSQMRNAKEGRDLASFIQYMESSQNLFYAEMDTVEGTASEKSGKRLLTIISPITKLFFSMIMPNGKSESVKNAFDYLYNVLGHDDFVFMFGVLLTDNGSEFARPEDIEIDYSTGELRSRVFFCNPFSSWQKGSIEVCHELLRRIIPKGSSLSSLSSGTVRLINSHINSYVRTGLGGYSSYDLFTQSFGSRGITILNKLHIKKIQPEDVLLKPDLIKP